MNIYLLPGLGADGRIYSKLTTIGAHKVIPLEWIPPANANNLAEYAAMLNDFYKLTPPYMLGGVSLGGMVAQEWAKLQPPAHLLLISTICRQDEWPILLSLSANGIVSNHLTKSRLEKLAWLGDKLTRKSTDGRALFYGMLHEANAEIFEWGAKAALTWKPCGAGSIPTTRVHGTRDALFPIKKINGAIPIQGGNHFMIFDKADEIKHALELYLPKG
jgi:pimeloyl-ACP methyl ester carboxylesterase